MVTTERVGKPKNSLLDNIAFRTKRRDEFICCSGKSMPRVPAKAGTGRIPSSTGLPTTLPQFPLVAKISHGILSIRKTVVEKAKSLIDAVYLRAIRCSAYIDTRVTFYLAMEKIGSEAITELQISMTQFANEGQCSPGLARRPKSEMTELADRLRRFRSSWRGKACISREKTWRKSGGNRTEFRKTREKSPLPTQNSWFPSFCFVYTRGCVEKGSQ